MDENAGGCDLDRNDQRVIFIQFRRGGSRACVAEVSDIQQAKPAAILPLLDRMAEALGDESNPASSRVHLFNLLSGRPQETALTPKDWWQQNRETANISDEQVRAYIDARDRETKWAEFYAKTVAKWRQQRGIGWHFAFEACYFTALVFIVAYGVARLPAKVLQVMAVSGLIMLPALLGYLHGVTQDKRPVLYDWIVMAAMIPVSPAFMLLSLLPIREKFAESRALFYVIAFFVYAVYGILWDIIIRIARLRRTSPPEQMEGPPPEPMP